MRLDGFDPLPQLLLCLVVSDRVYLEPGGSLSNKFLVITSFECGC